MTDGAALKRKAAAAQLDDSDGAGKRLEDLREAGQKIYEAVIPGNDLPDEEDLTHGYKPRLEEYPAPTSHYVRAVGPLLALRSPEENTDLVDKILRIPTETTRAQATGALLPHFGDLTEQDRSRLIDDTLKSFSERTARLDVVEHDEAARVLASARKRGLLTDRHESELNKLTEENSDLKKLLLKAERDLRPRDLIARLDAAIEQAEKATVMIGQPRLDAYYKISKSIGAEARDLSREAEERPRQRIRAAGR